MHIQYTYIHILFHGSQKLKNNCKDCCCRTAMVHILLFPAKLQAFAFSFETKRVAEQHAMAVTFTDRHSRLNAVAANVLASATLDPNAAILHPPKECQLSVCFFLKKKYSGWVGLQFGPKAEGNQPPPRQGRSQAHLLQQRQEEAPGVLLVGQDAGAELQPGPRALLRTPGLLPGFETRAGGGGRTPPPLCSRRGDEGTLPHLKPAHPPDIKPWAPPATRNRSQPLNNNGLAAAPVPPPRAGGRSPGAVAAHGG